MKNELFHSIIINSINEYLKNSSDKTLEITTALSTEMAPEGVLDLIKSKLKKLAGRRGSAQIPGMTVSGSGELR